jgi:septin 7
MQPATLFTQDVHSKSKFARAFLTLVKQFVSFRQTMASALSGLLGQARGPRNTSAPKDLSESSEQRSRDGSNSGAYPGSLNRHQRTHAIANQRAQFRSMLDIEDAPSLLPIQQDESMENWAAEKLSQTSQKHTTAASDWADILCYYTATNGVAPVAPTRAPAPVPNGKAASPSQEVPQSVSSTDPKVAAQQASDMRNIVRRKLTGYVGFANLPNQWHRKSVRKGFNFNVMVVGMFFSAEAIHC